MYIDDMTPLDPAKLCTDSHNLPSKIHCYLHICLWVSCEKFKY